MFSSLFLKHGLATAAATVCTLAAAGAANAAILSTGPQTGTFGPDILNIEPATASIDKFDTSLGQLLSVEVSLSGEIFDGILSFTNTGDSRGRVTSASIGGDYFLSTSAGVTLAEIFPVASVAPPAISINAGQSRTFSGLSGDASVTETYDASDDVFNAFKGPGIIDLTFEGLLTTSLSTSGSFDTSTFARGIADYSVVYYYEATEAVPEPTTLLGVAVAGGLGVLARKKLKQQTADS